MIDLQLQQVLNQAKAAGAPDLCDLPPPAAREFFRHLTKVLDVQPAHGVEIFEREITGPGGALRLRVYRLTAPTVASQPTRGVVVYLHGGGFALGSPDCYDGVCSELCRQIDCVLVQVDYRLAPEHPFPAAIEDCYAALCWVAQNARELGADADRLAIAGDSAGGNLATVLALLARDRNGPRIRQQTLIYPVTAPEPEMFPSYARCGVGTVLTTRSTRHFNALYFGGDGKAPDFRGAPLLAPQLANLPPALVVVAGYDVLRDEGVAYAHALQAAGTHVVLVEYAGLSHGFINMSGALDAARQAVAQIASALRGAIASG